ncbi:MAG: hypothetical protein J6Z22_10965 [Lachnospiraceae bacterium]|nr:hypothetical protein [Lachnospiraceae bacterium]
MNLYGLLDVAAPTGLVKIAGWIVLFFFIGLVIIVISVIVIRAELKAVKKAEQEAAAALEQTQEGAVEKTKE